MVAGPPHDSYPVAAFDRGDPVTFAIIMSRLESITAEMMATVERTAWTAILALARDFSCAIYDAKGRQISMGDALPVHTTSMHLLLDAIAETFGDDICDGDVFLTNHPYRGNTHAADLVTLSPVFGEGRRLFWTITKGHQLDVGASVPAGDPFTARNVWQEGIHVPPVKIAVAGEQRHDVVELFLSNVRYPDLAHGDLLAQLGSIERGRQRLIELINEYGATEVLRYVEHILDYGDDRMASEIQTIPDGKYRGETWIDSDGAGRENPRIVAEVTVSGPDVTIDYSSSDEQSRSAVNATLATALASGATPVLCMIDTDVPHNDGSFRHINTRVKTGTICRAKYPASTALATTVPADAMQDAVHRALAEAVPDRVPAGGSRAHNEPQFSGIRLDGETWSTMLFNGTGGAGGTSEADGWPMFISPGVMGGEKSPPIEQIELLYPLIFECAEIECDSMGVGRHIGGPGIRLSVRPTESELECVTSGDGLSNVPHGVNGGTPGAGGGQYVQEVGDKTRRFISPMGHFVVAETERWVGISSGGGGYGDPLERPVERIFRDVRDGLVSIERAAEVFGVIISSDGENLDEGATHKERERIATEHEADLGRAVLPVVPSRPGRARWLKNNQDPDDTYMDTPRLGDQLNGDGCTWPEAEGAK